MSRKRKGDKRTGGFISSLLYFALIMVVIYTLLGWAYAKESGEPYNLVQVFAHSIKNIWTDLTIGWNN